ncbi:hypothetical protein BGZ52_003842 [Haplosporangium bisporale]|nr:hypothetical protein BGZ52_003842 [Haplosporangium bisporale]
MSLQSSLLGFAVFKAGKRFLKVPFGPAENIVLQSVAVATGTMPLAAGFVGIIPALQMMTTADNPSGPVFLSTGNMILWSLAIAFFGVFIAVPLRKQVIVKEKLPFPSGTATAQMIGVLHNVPLVTRGSVVKVSSVNTVSSSTGIRKRHVGRDDEETNVTEEKQQDNLHKIEYDSDSDGRVEIKGENGERFTLDKNFVSEDNWTTNMTALGVAFTLSGLYTILSYFFPVVAAIPIFDWLTGMTVTVGGTWQWFLTPSLSYVGQGIIMGFPTTASMLLGCIVGWGILSPIVTNKGWVTGPVSSSSSGARGWILWVSLGVMIAEAVVSLLGVIVLSLIAHYRLRIREQRQKDRRAALEASAAQTGASVEAFSELELEEEEEDDAPIDQLVPLRLWVIGLILSSALCLLLIWVVFRDQHMPVYATLLAVVLGCILSVLGVRALGSTDLNPVSAPFIWGFAGLFAGLTLLTVIYSDVAFLKSRDGNGAIRGRPRWVGWIPSGIAFAIGMYNLPNFTLARFVGGVVSVWWDWHCKKHANNPSAKYAKLGRVFLIIIASGFVLGEGTFSIVNLILKTAKISSASGVGCYVGMCTVN